MYKRQVYYDNTSFEFYSTFGKIENMLYDHGFLRTHRSYIVSVDKIARINIGMKEIELSNGEKVPIGRVYLKAVKEACS